MRRLLRRALPLLLCLPACVPRSIDTELVFNIEPTPNGAVIDMLVESGPPGDVWVGFGVGPGVPVSRVERISELRAFDHDGTELEVRSAGYGGYSIEGRGDGAWQLTYRVDLRPDASDATFYRASVRGPEYLVLVGSDAWPRLYADPRPLSFAPDNRPPGRADLARVTLDVDSDSEWEVIATARDVTRRSFRFADHPATTVILAGRFDPPRAAAGVGLRVHRQWDVLPGEITDMSRDLADALARRLGPHSDARALAVMLPLPESLSPSGGLRTAGMVRGRTALLYGGLDERSDPNSPRIGESMAVFIGHELFHLYVPSAVPVTRDLSWMSEGWAMHMGRLVAADAGFVGPRETERQIQQTYRRYLDMGGYRAGSLPDASMGSESQRDLLYLRGELVFRLLSREWGKHDSPDSFEEHLWSELTGLEVTAPLDADDVDWILGAMVGPDVVRRYVRGTAPLTPGVLGLDR